MNDNAKAASILRQYAGELYQGHTIGGEWECAQIEAQHDEMMALADRLALADAGGAVAWRFNVDGMWFTASKREYCHKAIADAGIEAEIEPLYTHPAPSAGRVAELERERQISAELSRKVVALEQQLTESREREGRMREERQDAMRFFSLGALFDHIAINEWLVQGCVNGKWFRVYFKQPPQGGVELADGPLDALRAVVDQARAALAADKEKNDE